MNAPVKPRFHTLKLNTGDYIVTDMSAEQYDNARDGAEQRAHTFVTIKVGVIAPRLGLVWAKEITEKLNQFDISNAAVAKLT